MHCPICHEETSKKVAALKAELDEAFESKRFAYVGEFLAFNEAKSAQIKRLEESIPTLQPLQSASGAYIQDGKMISSAVAHCDSCRRQVRVETETDLKEAFEREYVLCPECGEYHRHGETLGDCPMVYNGRWRQLGIYEG